MIESEEQSLEQQSLLGEAIDGAESLAVFVWNEERNYVAVNEGACLIVGLPREELIGLSVGEMTDGHAEQQFADIRAGVTSGTLSFTRRDGETVELDWTTLPTRVAGLPYWVSICRRR